MSKIFRCEGVTSYLWGEKRGEVIVRVWILKRGGVVQPWLRQVRLKEQSRFKLLQVMTSGLFASLMLNGAPSAADGSTCPEY